MVKIENQFGDVKRGKQGRAVYQRVYGKQVRRAHKEKKDADTVTQHAQRNRFRKGIAFWNSLTHSQRQFLKSYMTEAGITAPDGLPTTLYSFVKRIAMTVPKVTMEVEVYGDEFTGTYASWNYRNPTTLSNTGSELSNFQTLITLTTENFDYSKCNEDGSDIRFSANDKTTPLSYYIQNWNYNGTSEIWVKVNSIPTGNSTIYLYHGNTSAESESNADATFDFYDGFSGSSVDEDKWEMRNTPTVSGGSLECVNDEYIVSKNPIDIRGKRIETQFKITAGDDRMSLFIGDVKTTSTAAPHNETGQDGYTLQRYDVRALVQTIINGSTNTKWENSTYFSGFSPANWHYLEIYVNGTSPYDSHFKIKKTEWEDVYNENWQLTPYDMYLYVGVRMTAATVTSQWELVRVRKYATSEPTSEIGEEEQASGGTKLKALNIHHPAIKSYELVGAGIKEEGLSNLEDNLSTSVTLTDLDVAATSIKVTTLDGQEYTFPVG